MENRQNKQLCPLCKKPLDRCKCDLDIKIGSKEEAAWSDIFNNSEKALSDAKRAVEINELIANYAKKRVEEEKLKFNSNA